MPEEMISVETQEFAEPATEEVESVETTEIADPSATSEETQEVAEPAKGERDAWFAEQRRKLEAEKKESESRFNAQLEAERAKIAELESFRKQYEEQQRETKLRQMAEETGVPYDELVEEVKRQEAAEELAKTLETERQSKATLEEKIKQLETDLRIKQMEEEDKDVLRKIDPNINVKELGDDFFRFRVSGLTPLQAYQATIALKQTTVVAPTPGKVNVAQPESDFISEAEFDAMSPDEQKKNWEKAYKSMSKW